MRIMAASNIIYFTNEQWWHYFTHWYIHKILASYTTDYALFEGTLVLYQDAGLGHMSIPAMLRLLNLEELKIKDDKFVE